MYSKVDIYQTVDQARAAARAYRLELKLIGINVFVNSTLMSESNGYLKYLFTATKI